MTQDEFDWLRRLGLSLDEIVTLIRVGGGPWWEEFADVGAS